MSRARLISLTIGIGLGFALVAQATQTPLSAVLVLSTTTVKAGGEISGQVVVENRTGNAITRIGCHSIFQVHLASSTYTPSPGWELCWQSIVIPTGQSSYPVYVRAAYSECSLSGATATIPACAPGSGLAPLPPGAYWATTFEEGNAIPLPATVQVRVI